VPFFSSLLTSFKHYFVYKNFLFFQRCAHIKGSGWKISYSNHMKNFFYPIFFHCCCWLYFCFSLLTIICALGAVYCRHRCTQNYSFLNFLQFLFFFSFSFFCWGEIRKRIPYVQLLLLLHVLSLMEEILKIMEIERRVWGWTGFWALFDGRKMKRIYFLGVIHKLLHGKNYFFDPIHPRCHKFSKEWKNLCLNWNASTPSPLKRDVICERPLRSLMCMCFPKITICLGFLRQSREYPLRINSEK